MATSCSSIAGLVAASIYQRINLLQPHEVGNRAIELTRRFSRFRLSIDRRQQPLLDLFLFFG